MRIHYFAAAMIALVASGSAHAETQAALRCAAFVAKSTPSSRAADAARVAVADPTQKVTASQIGKVMDNGTWRLVWATPKDAERGVYFFRRNAKGRYQLAGTWGGILAPGERRGGVQWARSLKGGGPDERLAECFANAVIVGE